MRKGNISHRQQKVAILINNALIEVLRQGKILDSRLINCPLTITILIELLHINLSLKF